MLHHDVYHKLLAISGTLQNDNAEHGTPNPANLPEVQEPYYEIDHDTQYLQYITDYISTDNTHAYLNTLSLVQLIHLYQNADYWSLETPILDNLQTYIVGKLQNKDVLNDIFSTQESLDTFLNACNSQTKATLAHTLLPYIRNLFLPLVTKPHQTLTGHTEWINSVRLRTDGTLFSCSNDRTIRVWKKDTQDLYQCAQTLTGHTESVKSLLVHTDGTLFSGSNDCTIRVWKTDAQGTYHCMQILTGHTAPIFEVELLTNGTLCSCSFDNTTSLWEKDLKGTYHCTQTSKGHTSYINRVVNPDYAQFSRSDDYNKILVRKVPGLRRLSLEQCLTVLYIYHQYQNNKKQLLVQVSLPAHNVYNTLPSSFKNIVIPWYNPTPLYKKLLVTGLAASIIGAGCYLYYKWFRK